MGGEAFGAPGLPGRWTSAQKSGVGTAFEGSPIWFTLSHGILNEVYSPRMDQAATRDLGLIVTGPGHYFSEEKRHTRHEVTMPEPGVPYYRLVNSCPTGRYRIIKDIVTDPLRPVVLQRIRFQVGVGPAADYHVFALLAAHLDNHGAGNTAYVGEYKGVPALFAVRGAYALCLMNSAGFLDRSVGFVGTSDGWQDLVQHGCLTWHFDTATDGNVALIGELGFVDGETIVALGMGRNGDEAAHQARAALADGFEPIQARYVDPWRRWQARLYPAADRRLFPVSAMVVRTHQSKHLPGAILASLAVPWGFAKGDGDLGGYHLVWPRDMVEAAGALLAAGDHDGVRQALTYLEASQEADGHWLQNMWVEGRPYWGGVQMDETALPILLVDLARREGALGAADVHRLWPMVRKAAQFIVQNGPVTQQDRWEEDGGYTPFTLSAEIAALLAAADLAELVGEGDLAGYLRETADTWNDQIERWLYVTDTETARAVGVEGYYVRITPPDIEDGDQFVPIKNRPPAASTRPASAIVSTDALALVRFGLRAANDPRILNTIRVIDALLKVETPAGPCWRRYNEDGYGEHEDGSPFDGTGIGRLWPLLTGERAHWALAVGQRSEAERLLHTMEGLAGDGGLLPEQVWDAPDIPERELFFGRPSGSAMPLVWAHAEYLKLVRSLAEERVYDMPPQTSARYLEARTVSGRVAWRFNHKVRQMEAGKTLRIEVLARAVVHWSMDEWRTVRDAATVDSGLGIHYVDLPTTGRGPATRILFTFYWPDADRWEGTDFSVAVTEA
jgi:glucoamylase